MIYSPVPIVSQISESIVTTHVCMIMSPLMMVILGRLISIPVAYASRHSPVMGTVVISSSHISPSISPSTISAQEIVIGPSTGPIGSGGCQGHMRWRILPLSTCSYGVPGGVMINCAVHDHARLQYISSMVT